MATVKDFKKALNKLLSKLGEYADDTEMAIVLDDNCGGSYPDSIGSFSLDYDGEVVWLNNL